MGHIGRNDPCPCGSGRKYKKCCLSSGGGAPYTQADREFALQRMLRSIHPDDMEDARDRFLGDRARILEQGKDPVMMEMAEAAFQFWVCFDELDDGETLADHFLAHERDLGAGERRFIEMGRAASMRLYEVIAVEPGAGLTLRDLLHGGEVRVRERSGSRSLHVWDLIAARVMGMGASGQPELDGGIFPLRSGRRDALVAHLDRLHAELDDAEVREAEAVAFFDAWIDPGMPQLVNFDGEHQLLTRVHFDVLDEAGLAAALDGAPDISRGGEALVWSWVGKGTQREEIVTRAFLRVMEGRLAIETNSRERGERVKELVEQLAGDSVRYRVTEHQHLEQVMREAARDRHAREPAAP